MADKIQFFKEDTDFKIKNKNKIRAWLATEIKYTGKKLKEINFIFCSDEFLLDINETYLKHDTYTDIITFDNSVKAKQIESDIFISVERVAENAEKFELEFIDELHRVMAHGVLHLLGYKDKNKKDKKKMSQMENKYLKNRPFKQNKN